MIRLLFRFTLITIGFVLHSLYKIIMRITTRAPALTSCLIALSLLPLTTCSTKPSRPVINYSEEDKVFMNQYKQLAPKNSKIGKDYKIGGEWYFPMHDPSYDKTGVASWYGPGMINGKTANGEHFDSTDFTAAHPSLPIPTIVEVTNLDNGKKVNVRVNDRGPFHSKRIIDVSKPAAQALGMIKSGTAKVRVRVLEKETLEYMQFAYNMKNAGNNKPVKTGPMMTHEEFWERIK